MPGEISPSKLLYRRKEAPVVLGFSLRTLDRLIAIKQMPVRRIGRSVFITKEALEQFIKRDHDTGSAGDIQ